MLSPDVVNALTLYSNSLMVASELCILVFVTRWYLDAETAVTEHVLIVWTFISAGYAFRIGFWALGVYVGGDTEFIRCNLDMTDCVIRQSVYPAWAIEWRWIMIIPALMVVFGNVMFIRYIEGFGGKHKLSLILVLVVLAALPILLS